MKEFILSCYFYSHSSKVKNCTVKSITKDESARDAWRQARIRITAKGHTQWHTPIVTRQHRHNPYSRPHINSLLEKCHICRKEHITRKNILWPLWYSDHGRLQSFHITSNYHHQLEEVYLPWHEICLYNIIKWKNDLI